MLEKSTLVFIMKLEKRDGGCEMFDIMTMAENIKTYRNKRGLNQYEFAEKLGISHRRYPNGSVDSPARVSKIFV